jgi:hypothetical protein
MTSLLMTTKGTDEGGHAPTMIEGSTAREKSPQIESLVVAIFRASSLEEKKVKQKMPNVMNLWDLIRGRRATRCSRCRHGWIRSLLWRGDG